MKRDFKEFKEFIKGKKVAVVGIGVSNRPLIYFLVKLGAKVSAFDKKNEELLGDIATDFRQLGVELVLGEGYLEKLTGFEVVFKTPSMRIDSEALVKVKNEGAYITSEMEEFVRYCPAKVFAVTGSDGKTTTTSLIYNILKEEGYKTWVGGNIGNPLFTEIENMSADHKVVLELSSFQLMTMDSAVEVAVVTNLSPNHLDMHKGMEEYVESKKNIFKYQEKDGILVLNKDNEITKVMKAEAKGRVLEFSTKENIVDGAHFEEGTLFIKKEAVCRKDEMVLKGMHNVENLLAAFCAVSEEVSIESMRKIATTFKGVEHRCEFVREVEGVKYYNDSIGSSPTRTIATISVFEKPVILIAGGYDKNIPFEPLAEKGYKDVKDLILLGATKDKIREVFEKVISENNVDINIYTVDSLEAAVDKAKEISKGGDNVVLSPACASFDMFENFEVRGNAFKNIVNNL